MLMCMYSLLMIYIVSLALSIDLSQQVYAYNAVVGSSRE